ncbi:hypothetical protein SKAU_G00321990 [Synaphobranchus kaupii]|uniref:HMG domain-containing protein n=1 Tax=Synaphobranchus kaupii TaxID=118154 RepID=A0A9Q1IJV8_SYNKA|nr:hypothetical protein SKAU_G00321990 [Synaphobranchus kaupii]
MPIHVQRKTWGKKHITRCELEECRQYQLFAQRSGLPFSFCEHVRSLEYCEDTASEEFLEATVLDEMVTCQFFGEDEKATCLKRQNNAQKSHAPFSVLVQLGSTSSNQNCLSIHEPSIKHFSRLGRVVVTYNKIENTWHCPCAKPRISCVHKNIGKWHLFQTNGDLFRTINSPTDPSQESQYPTSSDLERIVHYIYTRKKVPANLPDDVISPKALTEYPTQLFPAETKCTLCPGQPKLENPVQLTQKARIITMIGIVDNVSTYTGKCAECQMIYRYQEWQHGLHNFNDHVLLSLELCLFLRHNLQNHVSVSRVINSLESLRRVNFPARDTILHGYCHFEALSEIDYKYSCVNCGYFPPVVIMDRHKRGVFSMAVSDIKDPSEEYNGEQNVEDFWDSVHLEMICRGFVPSHTKNPMVVHPDYEHWAPWIGRKTRRNDIVINTEHEKVKSTTEAQLFSVTEDLLVDELMKQKVGIVRKLCKACNIDAKGSRMDLVIRLREEIKNSQSYDKVLQKIWGASGQGL